MTTESTRRTLPLLAALLLAACGGDDGDHLPGQLEYERIALPAELSEPVLALAVREGQPVAAGELLARLDPRRADARLARAEAELRQHQARLSELIHGARPETLDAARAALSRAQAVAVDAQREQRRLAELRQRELIAQAELDRADTARRRADADVRAADAQLRELTRGTREEQLRQAEAAVAAARAAVDEARIARDRLDLRAPRDGRVDALPFKPGDQPPPGAAVVTLLAGEPYARVFVPAARRADMHQGQRFQVRIEGMAGVVAGTLRSIASEPAFTPYFALAGDDASRLVYRAEIVLDETARTLPAGLPLTATPVTGDAR